MANSQTSINDQQESQPFETDFENLLLAHRLISEIRKNPSQISLTVTGNGLMELIRAIRTVLLKEVEQEKANSSYQDELITKKEVMDNLHISQTTLWLWEKKKYLVPVKIGRRVFYKRRDIEKLKEGK